MTQNDKKPEENDPPIEGFLRRKYDAALTQVGESLEHASKSVRGTLKSGENAISGAYNYVEDTIGKDRIIGAALGAKAGGFLGMAGGVVGMFKLGTIGAMAGFVGGRRFIDWYNKDENNDNKPPAEEETPEIKRDSSKNLTP